MKKAAVLAIDQGTTGTRAILYGRQGETLSSAYQEFRQYYPKPGWVEHDPEEIWNSVLFVIRAALRKSKISAAQIAGIGITNQRETSVLWDRRSGIPVHRAIVWQDRRTAEFCERLKRRGYENLIRKKTGLVLDAYFSGTKVSWLLEHSPLLGRKARKGDLCFGTIDTWLLWKLTGGKSHTTDFTNASRTLLFNIVEQKWDPELLRLMGVPASVLPEVKPSASDFGVTKAQGPFLPPGIPIYSLIGDQQAALYGQSCYEAGQLKNTYGTGCFVVLNIGKRFKKPPFGLLTTLACDRHGKPAYAFEGAVFIAGAAVQWLRDGLEFFKKASESEKVIAGLKDSGGVVVIPAFVGLGSPYWNSKVRGTVTGITRGTTRAHITRATLEAIAHQTADVVEAMRKGLGRKISGLYVDGGATSNRFLMRFQADLLGVPILVSSRSESTAWGAAKLAGRQSGFWPWNQDFSRQTRYERYRPRMKTSEALRHRRQWQKEIRFLLEKS